MSLNTDPDPCGSVHKACLADLRAKRYISVHHMMITGSPQCLIIATLLFCQNCGLPKSVEEEGGAQISKSNVTGEDEKTMLLQKSARSHQCCLLNMLQVCHQHATDFTCIAFQESTHRCGRKRSSHPHRFRIQLNCVLK